MHTSIAYIANNHNGCDLLADALAGDDGIRITPSLRSKKGKDQDRDICFYFVFNPFVAFLPIHFIRLVITLTYSTPFVEFIFLISVFTQKGHVCYYIYHYMLPVLLFF